jgi:hypothetical protein
MRNCIELCRGAGDRLDVIVLTSVFSISRLKKVIALPNTIYSLRPKHTFAGSGFVIEDRLSEVFSVKAKKSKVVTNV